MSEKHLAVLASFSGEGGVERMILNLAAGFVDLGCDVDLLVIRDKSAYLVSNIHPKIRICRLGVSHALSAVLPIASYLKSQKPVALLAAKDRASFAAVLAKKVAGSDCRLVARLGTTVSAALKDSAWFAKAVRYQMMHFTYANVDAAVAVSNGVADDLAVVSGCDPAKVSVIENPVITKDFYAKASESISHKWFEGDKRQRLPVILGMGRLTAQKDFSTLVKAFAMLNKEVPCRLVILGEGRERAKLESLAHELSVFEHLSMLGFVANPYPFLAQADLFVLSSAWEGSPNALTEALALGVPVVSTDCPSGPREILKEGKVCPLVPVGDEKSLYSAMKKTLLSPPPKDMLQQAASDYTQERSAKRYLELLLG